MEPSRGSTRTTKAYALEAQSSSLRSAGDEVDQFVRHPDGLEHGLAVEGLFHLRALQRQCARLDLGDASRCGHAVADLAVDLDDQGDRLFDDERGIEGRPRLLVDA